MNEVVRVDWKVFFVEKEDTHLIFCPTCKTAIMRSRGLPFKNMVLRVVAESAILEHTEAYTENHKIDLVDLRDGQVQQLKTSDYAVQQRRGSWLFL